MCLIQGCIVFLPANVMKFIYVNIKISKEVARLCALKTNAQLSRYFFWELYFKQIQSKIVRQDTVVQRFQTMQKVHPNCCSIWEHICKHSRFINIIWWSNWGLLNLQLVAFLQEEMYSVFEFASRGEILVDFLPIAKDIERITVRKNKTLPTISYHSHWCNSDFVDLSYYHALY